LLSHGQTIRGTGAWNRPCLRKFRATIDGSGVSSAVAGECDVGISAGTMTAGVVTITLTPHPRNVTLLNGHTYESAADRLRFNTRATGEYVASTGEITINCRADDDGTIESPANGETYELFFLVEEGKP
jgi:hypothetical protein